MGLNDIVVYVDSAGAAEARVEFAVGLAKAHGAHLIGIAFAPTTLLPLYGADVGFADMTEVLESVKAQGASALDDFKTRALAADAIEAAQQTFETAPSVEDEPGVDLSKLARPTSTWTYMVHDNPLADDTMSALSLPGVFR